MGFWEDNIKEENMTRGYLYIGNGFMLRELKGLEVNSYYSTVVADFLKVRIHNTYKYIPFFNGPNVLNLGYRFFATNFDSQIYINIPKCKTIYHNFLDYNSKDGITNLYLNFNPLTEETIFDKAGVGTMNFYNDIVVNTTSNIKNLDKFITYINKNVDSEFQGGIYPGRFVKGINNVQMSVFNAKYFKTTTPEEIVNSPYYEPNIDKPQVK